MPINVTGQGTNRTQVVARPTDGQSALRNKLANAKPHQPGGGGGPFAPGGIFGPSPHGTSPAAAPFIPSAQPGLNGTPLPGQQAPGQRPPGQQAPAGPTAASGIPDVKGLQGTSQGVTQYGLFSTGGAPPATGGIRPPTTRPPRLDTPRQPGPYGRVNPVDPTVARIVQDIAPTRAGANLGAPVNARPGFMPQAPGLKGVGQPMRGMAAGAPPAGQTMTTGFMGGGGPPPPAGGQPGVRQTGGVAQTPMVGSTSSALPTTNAQANASTGNPLSGLWNKLQNDRFAGRFISDDGKKIVDAAVTGDPGEVLNAGAGIAGETAAEAVNSFKDAYEGAGGGAPSFWETNPGMPGYEQNSLLQDVLQNWTTAMDPAAWEQMAANRLAAAGEQSMAATNMAERRMRDAAGRSGFANPGGAYSQMYMDHAGRMQQAERDIFNDTLRNQLDAIAGAGGFGLGLGAQDQDRWKTEVGNDMTGRMADFMAGREDNPSAMAFLQDVLGAAGNVAGAGMQAGGQAAGGIASLLMLLGGL